MVLHSGTPLLFYFRTCFQHRVLAQAEGIGPKGTAVGQGLGRVAGMEVHIDEETVFKGFLGNGAAFQFDQVDAGVGKGLQDL